MQSYDPDYTVNLRACDDDDTLYYRVAVTDAKNKEIDGFIHETENYNEALIFAKIFFDELSQGKVCVASYVEQPGIATGQGALYSIGSFASEPEDIVPEEQLYDGLAEEFIEHCARQSDPDVNIVFRKIVTKHKLNLYREGKLLNHLQSLGILEETDGDNEHWVEER